MTYSYDITIGSAKDQVRLLISDVGGQSGADYLFSDEEILSFLAMRNDSVNLAGALALRTIAANEAIVSKRIKFLELSTDGPSVAKALLDLATELTSQEADDGDIEIIEMDLDANTHNQLMGHGQDVF